MTPSDTPETDAAAASVTIENEDSCCAIYVRVNGMEYDGELVTIDFARRLERERNAARADADRLAVRAGQLLGYSVIMTLYHNAGVQNEMREAIAAHEALKGKEPA